MLKAGDVVFTERGHLGLGRLLIAAASGGAKTCHVAIASGQTTFVYESVTSGLRRQYLSVRDSFTVYRHKYANTSIGELIASIAEGYVAEAVGLGGRYGKYATHKLVLASGRGMGGEREQWGAARASNFYCSNFVARVLMAARQTGSCTYTGTIDTHIKPLKLKEFLASDPLWVPVL
jgi:hypothetical protein